jgi:hypothetical protein
MTKQITIKIVCNVNDEETEMEIIKLLITELNVKSIEIIR